jgi:hypothetical protein
MIKKLNFAISFQFYVLEKVSMILTVSYLMCTRKTFFMCHMLHIVIGRKSRASSYILFKITFFGEPTYTSLEFEIGWTNFFRTVHAYINSTGLIFVVFIFFLTLKNYIFDFFCVLHYNKSRPHRTTCLDTEICSVAQIWLLCHIHASVWHVCYLKFLFGSDSLVFFKLFEFTRYVHRRIRHFFPFGCYAENTQLRHQFSSKILKKILFALNQIVWAFFFWIWKQNLLIGEQRGLISCFLCNKRQTVVVFSI